MPRLQSSAEAVEAALRFEPTGYIPIYDQFWGGFLNRWRQSRGLPLREGIPRDDVVYEDVDIHKYYRIDLQKLLPNEDPWPGRREPLGRQGEFIIERDGWGRVVRRLESSPYGEPLELPVNHKSDLDRLEFEPATLDSRYAGMLQSMGRAQALPHQPWLFIKIGGPFLRSSYLRGETDWYMDISSDPGFARALASRVTDLMIDIGVEALRRCGPAVESIWIFDDVAFNRGMFISPNSYKAVFLPEVRRMVEAFRRAGARHIGYHSDGDVRTILDGLVDCGISILNPVEPRANMDVAELRGRYGRRLSFVGGLCNTRILPFGTEEEVRHHVERVAQVALEGGVVVGSHTVSNDMTLERYDAIMRVLHRYGRPLPGAEPE